MRRKVKWSGRAFSMKPGHPAAHPNPVTRVLNMVMRSDGSLERRRGFGAGASGTPINHIVAELNGSAKLIIKNSSGGFAVIGGGSLSMNGGDPPINGGAASASERGSFALHGGEVFYCDSNTIFVWDGVNPARRPGVIGLQGKTYNGSGGALLPGGPLGSLSDDEYTAIPRPESLWPDGNPGLQIPTGGSGTQQGVLAKGEKTLNTAFAFSYYDPVRKIFGRRSELFAYPYIFGPQDENSIVLTGLRTQYAKLFKTPTSPIHATYKIAVWFTIGQDVITNLQAVVDNGFLVGEDYAAAMSKRMSQQCFLEMIAEPALTACTATKDNATLVSSGQYIDAYERPVPAKFMAILTNGTAIYFFPWATTPELGGSASTLAQHALYSIRHPEQIGLNTETQRDTISPLPNLKGIPKATISDGNAQYLLTNQAIYGVGFDGGVSLRELSSGRGLRAQNSLTHSAVGTLWFADEGVCWLRGGGVILLDEKLGFGDWFGELSAAQKQDVVIGASDRTKEILMFSQNLKSGESGRHALVYNYERDFTSEFTEVGTPTYATFFRGDSEGLLYVFGAGTYPSDSYHSGDASITAWLNGGEDIDLPKSLLGIILDVDRGVSGSFDVTVESFHSGQENETNPPFSETRTESKTGNGRLKFTDCIDMRGFMFKITVTCPTGAVRLSSMTAYYEVDEAHDPITSI